MFPAQPGTSDTADTSFYYNPSVAACPLPNSQRLTGSLQLLRRAQSRVPQGFEAVRIWYSRRRDGSRKDVRPRLRSFDPAADRSLALRRIMVSALLVQHPRYSPSRLTYYYSQHPNKHRLRRSCSRVSLVRRVRLGRRAALLGRRVRVHPLADTQAQGDAAAVPPWRHWRARAQGRERAQGRRAARDARRCADDAPLAVVRRASAQLGRSAYCSHVLRRGPREHPR